MKRLAILGLAALFMAGCDYHEASHSEYSDQITHQQQWDREDKTVSDQHAYDLAHGGYSGAFACHTPDGGCLHMVCSTKPSCDYMAEQEKRCATPSSNDPKVLDRIVVKDGKCDSVEVPPVSSNNVTGTNTFYVASYGTGVENGRNGPCWRDNNNEMHCP